MLRLPEVGIEVSSCLSRLTTPLTTSIPLDLSFFFLSSTESVRCDTCKKFFHMHCLSPPLASKPAKGYSWTCAPCSRRHETAASGLPLSRTAALDASAAIASSSSTSSSDQAEGGSYTLNSVKDQSSSQRGTPSGRASKARGRGRGRGALMSQGEGARESVG